MDIETIIRLAAESGIDSVQQWNTDATAIELLERFAKRVAEHEREACAKVCDELHLEGEDNTGVAADLIRARGQA